MSDQRTPENARGVSPDSGGQQFSLEGTSRLNASGSTGSGTLTLPKHVTEPLLADYGKDFAVFSDGSRVLLIPQSEVTTDV